MAEYIEHRSLLDRFFSWTWAWIRLFIGILLLAGLFLQKDSSMVRLTAWVIWHVGYVLGSPLRWLGHNTPVTMATVVMIVFIVYLIAAAVMILTALFQIFGKGGD